MRGRDTAQQTTRSTFVHVRLKMKETVKGQSRPLRPGLHKKYYLSGGGGWGGVVISLNTTLHDGGGQHVDGNGVGDNPIQVEKPIGVSIF